MVVRIAALQMRSSSDRQKNLDQAEKLIKDAAKKGAQLVCLPETFNGVVEGKGAILDLAESLSGQTLSALKDWAMTYRITLVSGSHFIKAANTQVTNSSFVIDDKGKVLGRYDKIHLFDVKVAKDRSYRESLVVKPGKSAVVVPTRFGNLGLSICYDIRFPELYRRLSRMGAEILFVPAAFTYVTGKAHWDILTKARAIENQCFLVASAQSGQHNPRRKTWGHSRVIDPWGNVLCEKGTGVGEASATVDLKLLKKIRAEMPTLEHRQLFKC